MNKLQRKLRKEATTQLQNHKITAKNEHSLPCKFLTAIESNSMVHMQPITKRSIKLAVITTITIEPVTITTTNEHFGKEKK